MSRINASLLLYCALVLCAPQAASAVTIQWSPVGNAGNANDAATGSLYGGVGYAYNIGTYDVTNAQYAAFLTEKAKSGPLGLYNESMGSDMRGGITRSGVSGSFTYAAKTNMGNKPVNFVSWYNSIRFANWLNNGQGSGDTETGAYTLLGGTPTPSNGLSITRNAGASVFLPSESEWYKAAYYNPGTSSYFRYATSSNVTPTASVPTGLANHANYNLVVGNLTDVGAYTGTTSPYGAFDMNGNVWQWNEPVIGGSFRGLRGGSWFDDAGDLPASRRSFFNPAGEGFFLGFRVASVPEPSTGVLAVVACGLMWVLRKRFK